MEGREVKRRDGRSRVRVHGVGLGWAVRTVMLAMAFTAVDAQAAGRVALVVGNGDYTYVTPLPNPVNDAADVAAALERLGFDVTLLLNADRAALADALAAFETASDGAEVGLVFYAGHGVELGDGELSDGANYLAPVDARLDAGRIDQASVQSLDGVVAATAGASTRIVILDATFQEWRLRRRSESIGNLILYLDTPMSMEQWGMNLLVAYAGLPGGVVLDGEGNNSPYTTALLRRLDERPMPDVLPMFSAVGGDVFVLTEGQQVPSLFSTLTAPVTLQPQEPTSLGR